MILLEKIGFRVQCPYASETLSLSRFSKISDGCTILHVNYCKGVKLGKIIFL